MNNKMSQRNRNELKAKLAAIFCEKMNTLSGRYQSILLDDLVTAFESRLVALSRASRFQPSFEVAKLVEYETV